MSCGCYCCHHRLQDPSGSSELNPSTLQRCGHDVVVEWGPPPASAAVSDGDEAAVASTAAEAPAPAVEDGQQQQ